MLKKFLIGFFILFLSLVSTYSYKVDTINTDTTYNTVVSTTVNTDTTYMSLSEKVNKYLWFFMGTISFVVVIYAGILLITSNGTPEDLKKWNKMLVWGLVWIFVSLLSYVIVKLLIGLF